MSHPVASWGSNAFSTFNETERSRLSLETILQDGDTVGERLRRPSGIPGYGELRVLDLPIETSVRARNGGVVAQTVEDKEVIEGKE